MQAISNLGIVFCTDKLHAVSVDLVRRALEDSGLDPDLARDLAKRHCFTRAKNQLKDAGILDAVDETEDRWTWQLSSRYREQERLGYQYEATVWFDKKAMTVGSSSQELLLKVETLFSNYGGLYMASDVTKIVRRIFERQRSIISLRHAGGVYFVPEVARDLMDKVTKFIEGIGAQVTVVNAGLAEVKLKDKALEMLTESVKGDLGRIVAEIKASQTGDEITQRKAKSRFQALQNQIERIRIFAGSLNASANGIIKSVSNAEIDLGLVAMADVDIIASLAQSGRISGALAELAKIAYDGPALPSDSPRVRAMIPALGETMELPPVPVVQVPVAEVS